METRHPENSKLIKFEKKKSAKKGLQTAVQRMDQKSEKGKIGRRGGKIRELARWNML